MEKMFAVSNLKDDISFNLKVGQAVVLTAKDMPGLATMLSQIQSIRELAKSFLGEEQKHILDSVWQTARGFFGGNDEASKVEESIRTYLDQVGSGLGVAFAVAGLVADIKDYQVSFFFSYILRTELDVIL